MFGVHTSSFEFTLLTAQYHFFVEAKVDLDTAISKSQGLGHPACQAYTQRAMIKRLEGRRLPPTYRHNYQAYVLGL